MERNQLLLFMCESEENEGQRVASELSNEYNIVSCKMKHLEQQAKNIQKYRIQEKNIEKKGKKGHLHTSVN